MGLHHWFSITHCQVLVARNDTTEWAVTSSIFLESWKPCIYKSEPISLDLTCMHQWLWGLSGIRCVVLHFVWVNFLKTWFGGIWLSISFCRCEVVCTRQKISDIVPVFVVDVDVCSVLRSTVISVMIIQLIYCYSYFSVAVSIAP